MSEFEIPREVPSRHSDRSDETMAASKMFADTVADSTIDHSQGQGTRADAQGSREFSTEVKGVPEAKADATSTFASVGRPLPSSMEEFITALEKNLAALAPQFRGVLDGIPKEQQAQFIAERQVPSDLRDPVDQLAKAQTLDLLKKIMD